LDPGLVPASIPNDDAPIHARQQRPCPQPTAWDHPTSHHLRRPCRRQHARRELMKWPLSAVAHAVHGCVHIIDNIARQTRPHTFFYSHQHMTRPSFREPPSTFGQLQLWLCAKSRQELEHRPHLLWIHVPAPLTPPLLSTPITPTKNSWLCRARACLIVLWAGRAKEQKQQATSNKQQATKQQ
jgi:hypothetical protein